MELVYSLKKIKIKLNKNFGSFDNLIYSYFTLPGTLSFALSRREGNTRIFKIVPPGITIKKTRNISVKTRGCSPLGAAFPVILYLR